MQDVNADTTSPFFAREWMEESDSSARDARGWIEDADSLLTPRGVVVSRQGKELSLIHI